MDRLFDQSILIIMRIKPGNYMYIMVPIKLKSTASKSALTLLAQEVTGWVA